MSKQEAIDRYRSVWSRKTRKQVEKELVSYQRYLARHADGHFQQSAPDEMSDGDRIMVLKELLR